MIDVIQIQTYCEDAKTHFPRNACINLFILKGSMEIRIRNSELNASDVSTTLLSNVSIIFHAKSASVSSLNDITFHQYIHERIFTSKHFFLVHSRKFDNIFLYGGPEAVDINI